MSSGAPQNIMVIPVFYSTPTPPTPYSVKYSISSSVPRSPCIILITPSMKPSRFHKFNRKVTQKIYFSGKNSFTKRSLCQQYLFQVTFHTTTLYRYLGISRRLVLCKNYQNALKTCTSCTKQIPFVGISYFSPISRLYVNGKKVFSRQGLCSLNSKNTSDLREG